MIFDPPPAPHEIELTCSIRISNVNVLFNISKIIYGFMIFFDMLLIAKTVLMTFNAYNK